MSYLSSSYSTDFMVDFQLGDLYDNYGININDFEVSIPVPICLSHYQDGFSNEALQVKILTPYSANSIPILEKFSCSIHLESCIISDERILKALDVSTL